MLQSDFKFKTSREVSVRNRSPLPIRDFEKPAEIFSFYGIDDGEEHVVIALGNWETVELPLVRLHSECLTGDIFQSRKCDCGEQLNQAIEEINEEGGFIVYLRQEGRGIGLYNKIDAYRLQAYQGMDTYAANNHLGFSNDLRDFTVAADMLKAIGQTKIKLLSNNPKKKKQLEARGIEVVVAQPTGVFNCEDNVDYLRAKVLIDGHNIEV